ncbi:S8 family serine peptidase [Paenibacillus sp. FSL K6-0108]|uniref:S8 family serine peptidase n=1 Tax=Paenibacillus sp. FSL K6-0108 TaxID=2921417 RepID=UPI003255DE18
MDRAIPDPTWQRLGFSEHPDVHTSGQGVGIVIIDSIKPHHLINHLNTRIKCVTVHENLTVTMKDISSNNGEEDHLKGEHGLMSVLALTHEPIRLEGMIHVGIAPAATYIVLDHGAFTAGEGERLKKGMDWILEHGIEWNIKIILSTGWQALDDEVHLQNTRENSTVKALGSAVQQGILVICSNGNTRLNNIMPPIQYLAVGGYVDRGRADRSSHVPFPDEPYGRNGDGHFRPDVLAPRLHLTIPSYKTEERDHSVSYYGGTSGAAALVAGVAAYLFSQFPELSSDMLRRALVEYGDPFESYDNPAPRINVANTIRYLKTVGGPKYIPNTLLITSIQNPFVAIHSMDEIERALALTMLVRSNVLSREELWDFTEDSSPIVRKIAVSTLREPINEQERKFYWECLLHEKEGGVRGWYMHGLLQNAPKEEIHNWMNSATDINWSVRWCVSEYMAQYPEYFPQLEKTQDPDSIQANALPLWQWYTALYCKEN